ncbi:anti-sigma factor domain-containing protein [Oceanicella sp. SM1341]|uniref:anti-sigma factor n=1 Tax=Oceanicella sp. SM1341 TaxID=1548889 RepID=UPI000E4F2AF6|nr:anti-sigma factor [Oceanicella sp. SM1341]
MSVTPEDLERADAFALGLLPDSEAAALAARADREPDLAGAIARAEDRFAELSATAPRLDVSDDLWPRITAAIAAAPAEAPAEAPAASGPRPETGPEARPSDTRTSSRPGPRRSPRGWRRTAFAGIAASLVLAALLGWQLVKNTPPAMVAVLLDPAGQPVVMVEAFDDDRVQVTMLADIDLPPGRAMELWTKPDPDGPPVSLGLLTRASATTLVGPPLPDPQADQLYEITLEEETGSPTGGPTGEIVGIGTAAPPR